MKLKWILIGLLLVSLAMPVMAVTGLFDSDGSIVSSSYIIGSGVVSQKNITGIRFNNAENATGLYSVYGELLIHHVDTSSGTKAVNLYLGNTVVGTGTLSYSYNSVTGKYPVVLYISTLTFGSVVSGVKYLNFTPLATIATWNFNNLSVNTEANVETTVNRVFFSTFTPALAAEGSYIVNTVHNFHNTWTVEYSPPFTNVSVSKFYTGNYYPSMVYITNPSGTVLASNATLTGDSFTGAVFSAPIVQVCTMDSWGTWYNSSLVYGAGGTPTYDISVTPTTITPTTTTTGSLRSTIDPLLTAITDVSWKWYDATGYHNFYDGKNTSRPMEYSLKSGTWYGYDLTLNTYSVNKGTNIPNPVTLSGITSTGDKTIYCYIFTSDGNFYTLTASLTVGGTTSDQSGRVLIRAIDWRTNDQVIGAAINIKNIATGTWSNETTVNGRREYYSPIGTRLYLEAYKIGYDRASVPMYQISGLMDSQTIPLFPTGSGSSVITNTTLYVMVGNYNTLELGSGYSVRIIDDGQFKVTPASGIVSFTVLNGSVYTVSAGCSANQCYSGTKTETVSGSSYVIQFYLLPVSVATATPTLAPGVTASPTQVPTLDTRTDTQKANDMVGFLYDNGYTLVVLFFIATVLGVMQMMGGGRK